MCAGAECIRARMNVSDSQPHSGDSGKPAVREPDQTVMMECPVDPALLGAQVPRESAQNRQAHLIVISGNSIGKMFKLAGAMVIGRSVDCAICLDDAGISREHARIEEDARGGVWIADLGSTNGTYFIDGRRIDRQELRDGDKIRVGHDTILKLGYYDGLEEDFFQHQYDSATRDALTGIYNKRYFLDQLKKDCAYARRHGGNLGLISFDIDRFKAINDAHGHPAGDFILSTLVGVVGRTLRSEDWFARVGGEEFAVIARAADGKQARMMAERIRRAVETHPFTWEKGRVPVTISLGVAELGKEGPDSAEALVRAADEFLYRAKEAGRNRVAGAAD